MIKTFQIHSFKSVTLVLMVCALLGCGYNPEDPVYDTAANKDGYPAAALALLDDIERDHLVGIDSIGGRFAELYTENSDLLDNKKWKTIIERLGAKFGHKADSLAGLGPSQFLMAAEDYDLAAFARPDDSRAAHMAELFDCWQELEQDPAVQNVLGSSSNNLSSHLGAIRTFWSQSERHRTFARKYLLPFLLDDAGENMVVTEAAVATLSPNDRALAALVGLAGAENLPGMASFSPGIELVAVGLDTTGNAYRFECYFRVNERLDEDYSVSIRVGSGDTDQRVLDKNLAFTPYQFEPIRPSSTWQPGEIQAAYHQFSSASALGDIAIGLYVTGTEPWRFAPVEGGEGNYVRVVTSIDN